MIHIILYPRYCHRTFEQNMDIPNYGVYIYIYIHNNYTYIYIPAQMHCQLLNSTVFLIILAVFIP